MIRFDLLPLFVVSSLLWTAPALAEGSAGVPHAMGERDGLTYSPLVGSVHGRSWAGATSAAPAAASPAAGGEVASAPFGRADGLVAHSNGFLAVRFDPPFDAPYAITGISFPTLTQLMLPSTPAKFISVRILGLNAETGLPDESIEHFHRRGMTCSSVGGTNTIPLDIQGRPGQAFFAVFQFPPPPASADTFPFLFTDRHPTDRGLFARSFATDTNGAAKYPLTPGTLGRTIECLVDSTNIVRRASGSFLADGVKAGDLVGGGPPGTGVLRVGAAELEVTHPLPAARTTGPAVLVPRILGFSEPRTLGLLVDQNIVCSMTFRSQGPAPPLAPTALGLELDVGHVRWRFRSHPDELADGTPAPRSFLVGTELVRRDRHAWTVVGHVGGGVEQVTRGEVPGSGLQIWGVRSVDREGRRSEVSSVTISGFANLLGYDAPAGEDPQEPNGSPSLVSATALGPSTVRLSNSIWPAGDVDYFRVEARPGQDVSVRVKIPIGAYDWRNDMIPRVRLLSASGQPVAEAAGDGDPTRLVTLDYRVPGHGYSVAARSFFVEVSDGSPGAQDHRRVLMPCRYELTVEVNGPTPSAVPAGLPRDLGGPAGTAFSFSAGLGRGEVDFRYSIPPGAGEDVPVRLRIYDVSGRLVDTPIRARQPAGPHHFVWPGRDAQGHRVGSGLYFARLEAGAHVRTVRVSLVRFRALGQLTRAPLWARIANPRIANPLTAPACRP